MKRVEDFVYGLLTEVFNAENTAPLAIEAILKAGSHDLGPKAARTEDPAEWTEAGEVLDQLATGSIAASDDHTLKHESGHDVPAEGRSFHE